MAGLSGGSGKGFDIASMILQAGGGLYAGQKDKSAAYREADQLQAKANIRRGETQRAATEERRQGKIAQSRALAVAAASGGGVADPTVTNLMGDIETESEYRALSRMYEGETESQALERAATARKKEGRAARTAGVMRAATSLLTGVTSLKSKYG